MNQLFFFFFVIILVSVSANFDEANSTLTNTHSIKIATNFVKIIVKCQDSDAIFTNIKLDNSGSISMINTPSYAKTNEPSIDIIFNKCGSRKTDILSLFRSSVSNSFNGTSHIRVKQIPFFGKFNYKSNDN